MTQIRAQTELDCSDGTKMLIERMQTNPEDFRYGGKLYRAVSEAVLSTRDSKAYNDAHDKYIKEPALMASVLQALLVQPEEDEKVKYKVQGRYGVGISDNQLFGMAQPKGEGQKIWYDEVTDTIKSKITREMYEDQLQTHRDALNKHVEARAKASSKQPGPNIAAQTPSLAAQIHNKFFSDRIERDN